MQIVNMETGGRCGAGVASKKVTVFFSGPDLAKNTKFFRPKDKRQFVGKTSRWNEQKAEMCSWNGRGKMLWLHVYCYYDVAVSSDTMMWTTRVGWYILGALRAEPTRAS